ncbi:MAG: hemolysin family protein [Gemmatimonadota bacterium]
MTATLILLGVLILASGFFSGSEIALFTISRARARGLLEDGPRAAAALNRIKTVPERLLVTLLIGNNIVNISAASIATYVATQAVGSAGVGIATGVMTLLILFFGEIVPKSFATRNAERIALTIAPFFRVLMFVLTPVSLPFVWLTHLIVPPNTSVPSVTETEIRNLSELGHQRGAIDEHELQLIQRAFLMDSTRAWQVMTPRVEIFAWSDDQQLDDIAEEIPTVPYSRVPVHGSSLDDITGVLYVRDAYKAMARGEGDVRIADLARTPFFVPASVSLVQLLAEFRTRRVHLGVVVDEHGGTDGIVTLEDVLEELVGEIDDETDHPDHPIRRIGRNEIVVDAGTDLKDINELFGTNLPVQEHRSVNGLLLETLGRVPRAKETIEIEGVRIDVIDAEETQVRRVRMRRLQPPDTDPAGRPAG